MAKYDFLVRYPWESTKKRVNYTAAERTQLLDWAYYCLVRYWIPGEVGRNISLRNSLGPGEFDTHGYPACVFQLPVAKVFCFLSSGSLPVPLISTPIAIYWQRNAS